MGVVVRVYCREIRGFKVNIMVRVSNIKIRLGEITDPRDEIPVLKQKLLLKLKISEKELNHFRISKNRLMQGKE